MKISGSVVIGNESPVGEKKGSRLNLCANEEDLGVIKGSADSHS